MLLSPVRFLFAAHMRGPIATKRLIEPVAICTPRRDSMRFRHPLTHTAPSLAARDRRRSLRTSSPLHPPSRLARIASHRSACSPPALLCHAASASSRLHPLFIDDLRFVGALPMLFRYGLAVGMPFNCGVGAIGPDPLSA